MKCSHTARLYSGTDIIVLSVLRGRLQSLTGGKGFPELANPLHDSPPVGERDFIDWKAPWSGRARELAKVVCQTIPDQFSDDGV